MPGVHLQGFAAAVLVWIGSALAAAQTVYEFHGSTTGLWGDPSGWYAYNAEAGGLVPSSVAPSGANVYIAAVSATIGADTITVGNLQTANSSFYGDGQPGHTGTLIATGSNSILRGNTYIAGGLELRNEGTMTFDRDGLGNGNLGSGDYFRFRNASTGTLNIGTLADETRTIAMGYYAGYFANEGTANIDTVAGATVQFTNSFYYGGSQTNSGTLNKSGAGLLKFDAYYQAESGITNVTGGTLRAYAADLAGVINVSAGATFDVASGGGYLRTGLDVNGPGTFLLSGGSMTAQGASTFDNLRMTGGLIYNPTTSATVTVSSFNVSGGEIGSNENLATVYATGTSTITGNIQLQGNGATGAPVLVNRGTMTWTGGAIYAINHMYLQNDTTGVFIANVGSGDTLTMSGGYYSGYFENKGTFRKTGAGMADIAATYVGTGPTEVQAGVLRFSGYGEATGAFTISSGAVARLQGGTFTLKNGFSATGAGVFEATGGSLVPADNSASSIATLRVNGASVGYNETAPATLTVGNLLLESGALGSSNNRATVVATGTGSTITGSVTLWANGAYSNYTLVNNGTMTWSGGTISAGNYLMLKNGATGTFVAEVGTGISREITNGYYGGLFTNDGLLRKTGAGTAILGAYTDVTATGQIAVDAGRLELRNGGAMLGNLTTSTGAVTALTSGTLLLKNGFSATGGGTFEATGGSLVMEGSAALANLRVNGASVGYNESAPATLTVGNLTLESGALGSGTNLAGVVATGTSTITGSITLWGWSGTTTETLSNQGTMTWSGGTLVAGNYMKIRNDTTGTFIAEVGSGNTRDITNGYYGGYFYNLGSFVKTGAGTARIQAFFENTGTLSVLGGRLELQGGQSTSATSKLVLAGGGVLSASGPLNFTEFTGTGGVEGSVTVTQKLAPGASPGALTVTGNLTLAPGAASQFDIAGFTQGTGYDWVSVTGALSLNGSLAVTVAPGFAGALNSSSAFDLLTGGSLSGRFTNAADGTRISDTNGLGSFLVSYTGSTVHLGNWVATAIPEPAEWAAIVGMGALVVAGWRRRRKGGMAEVISKQ